MDAIDMLFTADADHYFKSAIQVRCPPTRRGRQYGTEQIVSVSASFDTVKDVPKQRSSSQRVCKSTVKSRFIVAYCAIQHVKGTSSRRMSMGVLFQSLLMYMGKQEKKRQRMLPSGP